MSFSNATNLKTALADWLARSDLTSYLDDFLTLAEGYFNRNLRHWKMEEIADLTPTDNVYTLPTDYLEYIRVVEKASIRRELRFVTPQAAEQQYPDRTAGLACDFTITGGELIAYPLSANDIELTYYQKIPTLVSNSSNWLLVEAPGLYLNAAKLMALQFINEMDTPRFQGVSTLVRMHIDDLNQQSEMALYHKAGYRIGGYTP